MMYVLSRSVGQSRAAGLASALGLGLGGVVLAVATALGLAAVFESVPWGARLMAALKYAGSAYLIWIGYTLIRDARISAREELKIETIESYSFSNIVWQGVLVEVLNPKTVLFLAVFIPTFINGGGEALPSNTQLQLLILGILVPLTAVPSDIVVAMLGGSMARTINQKQNLREILAWVGGTLLILIVINLHFELFG